MIKHTRGLTPGPIPQRRGSTGALKERSKLTEVLCLADLVEDPAVVPVAHLDVFSSIDKPSSHVELLKARVPDFSQEFVLQAAVDPSFDRHVLCDGMAKSTDCAPTEHKDGSTSAVDDGRIGVVDERASHVKAGGEDANKVAKQFHGLAWHSGRRLPVFDRRGACCVVEGPQGCKVCRKLAEY